MTFLVTFLMFAGRIPANPIARWEWVFPVVETLHIFGFTMLVGAVTILDLRLLDLLLVRQPVSGLAKALAPWIHAGIVVQMVTGPYLFSADSHEYLRVTAFRYKMLFLVFALIFHFTVVRRATVSADSSQPSAWRKLAAVVSLALWLSVLLGGMWIGNL